MFEISIILLHFLRIMNSHWKEKCLNLGLFHQISFLLNWCSGKVGHTWLGLQSLGRKGWEKGNYLISILRKYGNMKWTYFMLVSLYIFLTFIHKKRREIILFLPHSTNALTNLRDYIKHFFFPNYNGMKLKINDRKKNGKRTNICRLKNMLLKPQWVNE